MSFNLGWLKYVGKSVIGRSQRGYVALTDWRREVDWLRREGHLLAHTWDRIKWYNCPRFFITPDYPCHLELEASAACQMKCPMCAQGKMFEQGLKMGNMPMDMFKRIVDEIHDKVYSIKLSWRGEPSLNPRLHDMIRYAKLEKKMRSVAFLTNFERYDEKMLDDLLTTGVDYISISFDGMKDIYEKVRYPAKFEETLEKVKYLRRRRDELGLQRPALRVQSLYSAIKDDPEAYLELWEPIVEKVNFIADQWRASLDEKDYDLDPEYVCPTPFNRMAVGWDGKVLLCKSDYSEGELMGDLNTTSVHDVWHNDAFKRLRTSMKTATRLKNHKPCRTCTDGANRSSGDFITVHGRELPVRINAGRKVDAKDLDGSTNKWVKGAKQA